MTNKIKKTMIFAIGNHGNTNYLIIEKRKGFLEFINRLFANIDPEINMDYYLTNYQKGNVKEKKINPLKYTDHHESRQSSKVRLDIFYGKKKIFLTIQTSEIVRSKIMNNLEKLSVFMKYKGKLKLPKKLK